MIPINDKLTKLELEILRISNSGMAITITFRDVLLSTYKSQFIIQQLYKVFEGTRGINSYCLVSDYSKVGRLHMHGSLVAKDVHVLETLRKKLYRKFGICRVKPITDAPKWAAYCFEQYTDEGKEGVKIDPEEYLYVISNDKGLMFKQ